MYFANYCANDKITSLGPKKSIETYISKKETVFTMTKDFSHFNLVLSRMKDLKRMGPQVILTVTVELLRPFFKT